MITLSWTFNGQIVDILVDATLREAPESSSQVTEHPAERGPNITDHIRPMPRKLSIDAFITNTPINGEILSPTSGTPGEIRPLENLGFKTLQFETPFNRVGSVYSYLLTAQKAGVLFTIATSFRTYVDFAITHMSSPRDSEHSNALVFSIDFQEIIQVSLTEVDSPAPKFQQKDVGQKVTTIATTEQKAKTESFIHRLVH